MSDYFQNKKILVTGGAGSIGSAIVHKLLSHQPAVVRVLDNNESALFELQEELQAHDPSFPQEASPRLRFLVGDVRDGDRLHRAMEGIDIVFHAAALKHVPLCEYNPFESVKTNVLGTQNAIDAALASNVQKFIFISTDKAVNPVNAMGASKLLGERLTLAANDYRGLRSSVFSVVRFGNVLASRGSVIPLFLDQIKRGGPVTITDPQMLRFIMPLSQAVQLILQAAHIAEGGEIFILPMAQMRIQDLAEVMIAELAPRFGKDPKSIRLQVIGMKKGEKLQEELITELEKGQTTLKDGLLQVSAKSKPTPVAPSRLLTKKEIAELLKDMDWGNMRIS